MVARAPTEQLCGTVPPASATTAWQVAFLVTGEFREFTAPRIWRLNTPSCWSAEGRRPEDHHPNTGDLSSSG